MEDADKALMQLLNAQEHDVSSMFRADTPSSPYKPVISADEKQKRQSAEADYFKVTHRSMFYLTCFIIFCCNKALFLVSLNNLDFTRKQMA